MRREDHQPEGPRRRRGRLLAVAAIGLLAVVGLRVGFALSAAGESPGPRRPQAAATQRGAASPAAPSPALGPAPTADWQLHGTPGTTIAGYADRTSVLPGQSVQLRVQASASAFRMTAFRIGDYGATPAGRVWAGGPFPAVAQPAPTEIPATRTITTNWKPTATVPTAGWPVGAYLLRLEGTDGAQSYVPLTVRSSSAAGRVVLVQAVTDWQAYNDYGGLSLYHGSDGRPASRSYAVSFDRPYAEQGGAGDFLGNDLPLIVFAEQLNLPLAYATDVDLQEHPHLLDGARMVVSPGHDEYYSSAMRQALTAARDAGANLAFLGANAVYRHIRLAPTAVGPDRLEIDYKDPTLDPVTRTDPSESTAQWDAGPDPRPESSLLGDMWQCSAAKAPLVVAPELSWLTEGLGLHPGQQLGVLAGPEYDRVDLSVPTPHPIQVIFHSPLTCNSARVPYSDASDVTYYTAPSGAGVFDSGTSKWECALSDTACNGWGDPATYTVVRKVTERLLTAGAQGPLGGTHPAVDTAGGPPGPNDGVAGIAGR